MSFPLPFAEPSGLALPPPTPMLPLIQQGPPPPWPDYKPPPRPKLADVLANAEREREWHEGRITQGYDMLRRFNMDPTLRGFFRRDIDKVRSGEITTYPDPAIRNEIFAICTFLAQMDWVAKALYRLSI